MSTEVNRALWDERAPVHAASSDYGFGRFAGDRAHLSDTVRFDLPRLGEVVEHDSVPWEAIPGQMVRAEPGEWRLRERPERLPHTYTLQALRPA